MTACYVDRAALARLIEDKQRACGWSLRQIAAVTGVSASELCRIKQGGGFGGDTLVTVLVWIGVRSDDVSICEGLER